MVQELKICLPMQGTQVRFLAGEDSTCLRATKSLPQLLSLHSRACKPQLLNPQATATEPACLKLCSATREATAVRSPRTATRESLCTARLSIAIINKQSITTVRCKMTEYRLVIEITPLSNHSFTRALISAKHDHLSV